MFASKDLMFGQQSGGYQISRSVRLRSSASAYFSNGGSDPRGNSQVMTISFWFKRGNIGSGVYQRFFCAGSNSSSATSQIGINDDYILMNSVGSGAFYVQTVALFRDPSAWYHVVCLLNTTNATNTERVKIYINNVLQTLTSVTYPAQNAVTYWGQGYETIIGSSVTGGGQSNFFDGYLAEFNCIDGQALTPTSFGAFDAVTGVWNPKKYSGTYGTNGFYLNFSDNSGATATTIGKDSSGNGNNWTPNNISVTAGTTYDSMVDVPTNYGSDTGAGGEVRGNYAVLNAVDAATAPSDGNLRFVTGGSNYGVRSTIQLPSSGKWYSECSLGTTTSASVGLEFGFAIATASLTGTPSSSGKYGIYADSSGYIYSNGTTITSSLGVFSSGTVLQIAYDGATGNAWVGKSNVWYNSSGGTTGNPATGANPTFTSLSSVFVYMQGVNGTQYFNAGQRAFTYTAPSGFKALCTQNLPTPTISNGANYVAASLYTGTGASQTVSNAVNSISFQPDLVWIKSRSAATDHKLTDSVRGVTKALISDTTGAETTDTNGLTAFSSSGFTVGTDTVYNNSGATYVGWQWKGGGTGVSNTSGSITSTVSANTTAGFSVVTYTGNGTNGSTIGHGLGVAPKMIIVKSRSITDNWPVYHGSMPNTDAIRLNTTGAAVVAGFWNNTTPGATVFTVGGGTVSETNTTSATYVAYCFAPITGYSAFGSYTGNGSTDGPFVYCGFRPRFVLWKRSDSTGSWYIQDTSRNPYNQATLSLYPNLSDAETSGDDMDYLSNGFKVRDTFSYINASGGTFLYAAFAENPFTIARAR